MKPRNWALVILVIIVFVTTMNTLICTYSKEIVIEPEYISALLTASSIVFGFWVSLLAMQLPKKEMTVHHGLLVNVTIALLFLLSVTVLCVFLSAVGWLDSCITLAMVTVNFLCNIQNLMYYFLYTREK
jgi:hypothetical protein